jgi:mannan endo-1,4-beta-mannosidase
MADVLIFDCYQYDDPLKNNWFVQSTQKLLCFLEELSEEKHKLFALAETKYEAIPYDK